jgi:hypothetical protein
MHRALDGSSSHIDDGLFLSDRSGVDYIPGRRMEVRFLLGVRKKHPEDIKPSGSMGWAVVDSFVLGSQFVNQAAHISQDILRQFL